MVPFTSIEVIKTTVRKLLSVEPGQTTREATAAAVERAAEELSLTPEIVRRAFEGRRDETPA
jgi:DNA-binding LacI/PurR family transcriptional regulator